MKTVARCYCAGLSLAALGRLGVAVGASSREETRAMGGLIGEGAEWWREGARGREAARRNLGRWFVSPPRSLGLRRPRLLTCLSPHRSFQSCDGYLGYRFCVSPIGRRHPRGPQL